MTQRIAFGGMLVLVGLGLWGALIAPGNPAPSPPGAVLAAASSHSHGEHPDVPCALFAPGTPWEVVQRVTQAMIDQAEGAPRFVPISGAEGTPWSFGAGARTLRYSFVPDGVNLPSGFAGDVAGPSVLNARMNTLFGAGNTAVWKGLFAQCFTRWSQITGITYTLVNDDGASWGTSGSAARGDIRIGMRNIDGANGILAFNQYPTGGDMILDSSENWASNGANNNYRFLRNTVMHEHGHGVGLKHVCPIDQSKLMEPFLNTNFDGPQHDDLRGGQDLYGDRFEPNQSASSPALLGFLAQGVTMEINEVSIRNSSDSDVFSFTVSANSRITVSVSPVGLVYNQGPQSSDGSCTSPTPAFDSTNISDLQFSLLNSAQSVLVTANATPFRGSEQIVNYLLTQAGFYYLKVSAFAQNGSDQVYSIHISVHSAASPCPADLNGDGVVNSTDLGLLLGNWAMTSGPADINSDGHVDSTDLGLMLGNWGNCP